VKRAGWIASAAALSALALVVSRRSDGSDELLVFAAASLRDACAELGRSFTAGGGASVHFNFGGSNELALQLLAGARADAFLSADELQMDRVESAGLLAAGSRRALLSNTLVVVAPASDPPGAVPFTPALLAAADRIARLLARDKNKIVRFNAALALAAASAGPGPTPSARPRKTPAPRPRPSWLPRPRN